MSRHGALLSSVFEALRSGKPDSARSALQRALQKDPADPELNRAMALALLELTQGEQALYYAGRALAARPEADTPAFELISAVRRAGLIERLTAQLTKAFESNPKNTGVALALATILETEDRYSDAADLCRRAYSHAPRDTALIVRILEDYSQSARPRESAEFAREVLATNPDQDHAAVALAFDSNYLDPPDKPAIFEAHRRVGALIDRMVGPVRAPAFANRRDPDKPLRVGLMSPDLREHSVGYFADAILRARDRARLEIVCFNTGTRQDGTSERFAALADGWRDVHDLDDASLAAAARRDAIDVFIELSGLTGGHRLPVFRHGPAPITATYLGYPNTTGLSAVQYRLVDSRTDPPGEEAWCVESLVRLDPCFVCYTPPGDAPEPAPVPSRLVPGGPITFGSFNTLSKLTDATVAMWASVLHRTPGSRLVLKAPQLFDPGVKAGTLRRFGERGVDPGRVVLLEKTRTTPEHLAQYGMIDVALDPYPYAGTTTTCEAVWMGVPVVTRAGPMHASRVGASLLSCVGQGGWVARDADEFVAIASRIASDAESRAGWRSSLRARMAASALCDAPGFAGRFEMALRPLWRRWCAESAG